MWWSAEINPKSDRLAGVIHEWAEASFQIQNVRQNSEVIAQKQGCCPDIRYSSGIRQGQGKTRRFGAQKRGQNVAIGQEHDKNAGYILAKVLNYLAKDCWQRSILNSSVPR
ncbi:hypothetical protein CHARACLAT_024034 [Characodon lateralis]|uniref:Ribosomal protein L15 n=1 Tax=Characodon lateralis TaxID=208331 RepID=A0ABU7ELT4_9TELE|nr:hypothetical protein [Characodon lateralis]